MRRSMLQRSAAPAGDREAQGLSGARFGNPDEVEALHQQGPRDGLCSQQVLQQLREITRQLILATLQAAFQIPL